MDPRAGGQGVARGGGKRTKPGLGWPPPPPPGCDALVPGARPPVWCPPFYRSAPAAAARAAVGPAQRTRPGPARRTEQRRGPAKARREGGGAGERNPRSADGEA